MRFLVRCLYCKDTKFLAEMQEFFEFFSLFSCTFFSVLRFCYHCYHLSITCRRMLFYVDS